MDESTRKLANHLLEALNSGRQVLRAIIIKAKIKDNHAARELLADPAFGYLCAALHAANAFLRTQAATIDTRRTSGEAPIADEAAREFPDLEPELLAILHKTSSPMSAGGAATTSAAGVGEKGPS